MQLNSQQRTQLVEELWEQWLPRDDDESNAAIVALLEARMAHYRQHPETAKTWGIGGNFNCERSNAAFVFSRTVIFQLQPSCRL